MSGEASTARRVREHISAEFTTNTWVMIPVGAALGTAGGVFTQALRLPIYLDALGTVLVAILAGPWPALVTGLFTNVLEGFIVGPTWFAYAPLNMAFGLVAGYMFLNGWAKSYAKLFVVALAVTVTAIIIGTAITTYVFGGITGAGTSVVVGFFLATGSSILESVLQTAVIFEPIDKILTVFVAYFIAQAIPARYRPEIAQQILPEDQELV